VTYPTEVWRFNVPLRSPKYWLDAAEISVVFPYHIIRKSGRGSASGLWLVACCSLLLTSGCECPYSVRGTLRGVSAEALSPPLIDVVGDAVRPLGFTGTKLRYEDLYAYEFGGGFLAGSARIEISIDPKSLTVALVDFGRHESKFNTAVISSIQQRVTSAYGTSLDLKYQTPKEHYSCVFGP
jgi:hypothetical protein